MSCSKGELSNSIMKLRHRSDIPLDMSLASLLTLTASLSTSHAIVNVYSDPSWIPHASLL